jgi:hypothetical protein
MIGFLVQDIGEHISNIEKEKKSIKLSIKEKIKNQMSSISNRSAQILNLKPYEDEPRPEKVGFEKLSCPFPEQYILRMPIRVDGKQFLIPKKIDWIKPFFQKALDYQRNTIQIEHSFCYVTVRHGYIKSETDDEWHVDGFSTKISHIPEQNYIWSNCYPTEYLVNSITFPDDFNPLIHNINSYLSNYVTKEKIKKCLPNVIYCIDPYILHRRPKVKKCHKRTFCRISFTPIEINDINNTPNPFISRHYTNDGVNLRNKLIPYS